METLQLNIFQSNEREIDIALTQEQYRTDIYLLNDFLFHSGSYDLHIGQGIPDKKINYLTIFKPFDGYIWVYIGASVVIVFITFIIIDIISSKWTDIQTKDVIFHSNVNKKDLS